MWNKKGDVLDMIKIITDVESKKALSIAQQIEKIDGVDGIKIIYNTRKGLIKKE